MSTPTISTIDIKFHEASKAISANVKYGNLYGSVLVNSDGFARWTTPDYWPYWVKLEVVQEMKKIQQMHLTNLEPVLC